MLLKIFLYRLMFFRFLELSRCEPGRFPYLCRCQMRTIGLLVEKAEQFSGVGLPSKVFFVYCRGNLTAFRQFGKFLDPAIAEVIAQMPYYAIGWLRQP